MEEGRARTVRGEERGGAKRGDPHLYTPDPRIESAAPPEPEVAAPSGAAPGFRGARPRPLGTGGQRPSQTLSRRAGS